MAGMTELNRIPRLQRTQGQTNERNRLYASLTPRQRSELRPRTRTPSSSSRSRTPKTPSSPNSKRDRNLRKSRKGRKARKTNTRKY